MVVARKTIALAATAWLLIAGIGLGQASARKAADAGAFRKAVAHAHELRVRIDTLEDQNARDAAESDYRKAVAGFHELFPEFAAAVGEKAHYVKVPLNARGGGFDAIRFRVPSAGRTYQLHWSVVVPGTLENQNVKTIDLLAVNGDQMIWTRPEIKTDVAVSGLNFPQPNWWGNYRVYGHKLQAGQEYLICFDLKSDRPAPIFSRLRIEPLETAEPPHTAALQTARTTFQDSLDKLNRQYDDDIKVARRRYLGELDRTSKAIAKKSAAARAELVAEADRANLGDSETSDPRNFRIIRAETGVGDQWNDVTLQVRKFVRDNRLKVNAADFDFKQDAAAGVAKTLIIVYMVDGKPGIYAAPSERNVDLPPASTPPAKK